MNLTKSNNKPRRTKQTMSQTQTRNSENENTKKKIEINSSTQTLDTFARNYQSTGLFLRIVILIFLAPV